MKKIIFFVLAFAGVVLGSISCDSQKTAQEYLKEEKKAIDRFINRNDLVILKEYPKDGVFKEKEFFKTSEGLYMHVVDSGNGTRVKALETVLIRYGGVSYFKSDTTTYSYPTRDPFEIIYGNSYSYGTYGCTGWVIPLSYVGEEAIVDLIIPSALGSSDDNSSFRPVYYKNLKYRFY